MTRQLLMIRHGETTYNATRRMQGQLDTDLSERGRDQAIAAGRSLADANIGLIISSDLKRAADTAQLIAEQVGVGVARVDARLRETHLGAWQGRTHVEVDGDHPGARAYWRHDATWAPPGGESRLEVARRARPVVDELMASYPQWDERPVLLVAHGGTISALTSNLLGLATEQYPLLGGLGNTRWSQLVARRPYEHGSAEADSVTDARIDPEDPQAQWYLAGWNVGAGS
ncbi:histidine phosphatase family protein [Corynebacterium uberis]|uniref:histidine phosphatase family protein n=1 Tax=Corynebacterium TaxID=1716 RepID=UPI001D0A2FEB|nr:MULTISPECIES: histidine phosphatase family protein [Corynebacterium]MCZ9310089.1 histidine phosphatase family protein [Corynebacterium sp. c6VSa_13]UDL73835.1 histidine phosphatase family protein [Corynebacterium uberis]UDL75281.1 histidine phosphatase family protein [Corynebacterium uberis]UDL77492.1 histidine phosphatase family protein [Corynebacterium uberis]UDL79779.1 histidine phosphatase family protein [Corynebacterium uberis]